MKYIFYCCINSQGGKNLWNPKVLLLSWQTKAEPVVWGTIMLPHNIGWKKSWAIGISHSTGTNLNLTGCIPSLELACCLWGRPNIPALVSKHTQQHSRSINQMHPRQKNRDWHPSKMSQQSGKEGRPFRPQLTAWLPKGKTLGWNKTSPGLHRLPSQVLRGGYTICRWRFSRIFLQSWCILNSKSLRRLRQNLFYAPPYPSPY